MAGNKGTRVAVLLGGRSPEHDVSVITGLQALQAIDQTRFDAFPVYVNPRGQWFVGEALADRRNYLPDARTQGELTEVTLSLGEPGKGLLVPKRSGLFGRGLFGGGRRSSSMSRCWPFTASTARTGRSRASSRPPTCPMPGCARWPRRCSWTRSRPSGCCAASAFRCCPMRVVARAAGGLPSAESLKPLLSNIGFPCIVKPVHLGSSIGVGKADSIEDVRALLPAIFRLDPQAMIEPFVPNLVEYNLAVTRIGGAVRTLGDRTAETRRGAARFPAEIPVRRRRQERHERGCGAQPGHAVADPRHQPGAARRASKTPAALGDRRVRGGLRNRRAAHRFLLQRGDRRSLAQRSQPDPGLVRAISCGRRPTRRSGSPRCCRG